MAQALQVVSVGISIHALREEGDLGKVFAQLRAYRFLSTPSARRATRPANLREQVCQISIHALREEGDLVRGGYCAQHQPFLSTPSARRATVDRL